MDGLSIDTKMKEVWGKIGKLGGSGGNPEEWAIKGVLRGLALRPIINRMKDEGRMREAFFHFHVSPLFQFHNPVLSSSRKSAAEYAALLKYRFGGDFGTVLQSAFDVYGFQVSVKSIAFSKLQFFHKLRIKGQAEEKCFRTYIRDSRTAAQVASGNATVPRVGSNAIVHGLPGEREASVLRIQVTSRMHMHISTHT